MVDMPKAPDKFKKRLMPAVKLLMPDELDSEEFKNYIYDLVKNNPDLTKGGVSRSEIRVAIDELRKSRDFKNYVYEIIRRNPDLVKKSDSGALNKEDLDRAVVELKKSPKFKSYIEEMIKKNANIPRSSALPGISKEDLDRVVRELRKSREVIESFNDQHSDINIYQHKEHDEKSYNYSINEEPVVLESEPEHIEIKQPKVETKQVLTNSEPKSVVDKNFSDFNLKPAKPRKKSLFSRFFVGGSKNKKPKPGSEEDKIRLLKEDIPFEIDLFPKIINLPDLEDRTKINIRYPLLPPFAFAHIFWDDKNKELFYRVEEPILSDQERELLHLIQVALEEMINVPFTKAQNTAFVSKYLQKNVQAILIELSVKITRSTYQKLMYYVYRDGIGMNEIEPFLKDYYIEDIECNGVGFPLYIVHRKYGNLRTNVLYKDYEKLGDFVEKLAQKTGRYVSYASPLLDGALPDGSRVNATYTIDITTRGPTFTIRKFTKEPWSPSNMISFKTATAELFAYLWLAIEYKFNIMVIGETGSGKTSFLNSILQFIPSEARITSVEDTRELNLMHDNWLPAVQRMGFGIPNILGQKYGEVTMFDLLKESFRQNPDYMVIGEVRGAEAYVLFQGMASGHPSYGTFHANDVNTMIRRLETAPINLSPSLVESMDIVVVSHHVKTSEKSIRRIREVMEIKKVSGRMGEADTNRVFEWDAINDKINYLDHSVVFDKVTKRIGVSRPELEKEFARRTKLLTILEKKKISEFKDFKKVINNYYKDKKGVLAKFGIKV